MSESYNGNCSEGNSSEDGQNQMLIEHIYDTFRCPLTKQLMEDPVSLETGHTFERNAIEKYLKEWKNSGRKPICPVTLKELNTTDLIPSIPLRNTIKEWRQRNEVAQLDFACNSLSPESSESDALRALNYIQSMCQKSRSRKQVVRNKEVIPLITGMLKSSTRSIRCKALETLRIIAEDDDNNREAVAVGDTIRTVVKFLARELTQEREEAVFLLYELSKSKSLSDKIGMVNGAILILVGVGSSNSEDFQTVQKAEKTLQNLEMCESNVLQMAESGRIQPLLRLLLEGSPETQLNMATYLGDLVSSNDQKVLVARTAGPTLVNIMRSGTTQAREAALKALNQISSYESSARVLIDVGILPPLVRDLFAVSATQLPMKLKEISATILANIIASGADFASILLDQDQHTLVSEDIVHNLLHLISNAGPAIECKLLQVLVGLTSSQPTVQPIVSAIKSSGATITLIQFIEAPQWDIRLASLKLLHNISPYMNRELARALHSTAGQLSYLIKIISENNGISEEQAAAVGFLAELPERDSDLTQQLLSGGAFPFIISQILRIRHGETRGSRFFTPYFEGLVTVLSRITYVLEEDPSTIALVQEHNLTSLFIELLQTNGLDKVQTVSAMALDNLSQQSQHLTRIPESPDPGLCGIIFPCFGKPPLVTGLCRVHHGICSMRQSFCLLEGKAVEKLIAYLDHANEKLVEAALAALCTLLDNGLDVEQGVLLLWEAEGIKPILQVLVENRTEILRAKAVWAVERILRTEEIAIEVSGDQNIGSALVEAFRHGDYQTRQIAEKALKRIDKLPNFSGIFPKVP